MIPNYCLARPKRQIAKLNAAPTKGLCWLRYSRDSEQSSEIGVAVSVHLYALGSGMARPSTVMPNLMTLQRLDERALPPAGRAGRPENGRNGSFGDIFP